MHLFNDLCFYFRVREAFNRQPKHAEAAQRQCSRQSTEDDGEWTDNFTDSDWDSDQSEDCDNANPSWEENEYELEGM